jgi:hypothetical protein
LRGWKAVLRGGRAAEHYDVSARTAVIWVKCFHETGRCSAKPRGGSTSPLGEHAEFLLALIDGATSPDAGPGGLCDAPAQDSWRRSVMRWSTSPGYSGNVASSSVGSIVPKTSSVSSSSPALLSCSGDFEIGNTGAAVQKCSHGYRLRAGISRGNLLKMRR